MSYVGCGNGMAGGWGYYGYNSHGYLGQDGTDGSSMDISSILSSTDSIDTSNVALMSQPGGPLAAGGILDPNASDQISVGQLQSYVATGSAPDPSTASQLASIVAAAGPAVTSILQQAQFGSLAANTPISQLAALKAAITGTSPTSAVLSTISSNPILLVGLLGLAFMMFSGRRG